MKPHYYLVVSTGIIHGIYGSAIKHMAEERAESIPFAYVVRTYGKRPSVGEAYKKKAGDQ